MDDSKFFSMDGIEFLKDDNSTKKETLVAERAYNMDMFNPLIWLKTGEIFARGIGLSEGVSIRMLNKQNIVCFITLPKPRESEIQNVAVEEIKVGLSCKNHIMLMSIKSENQINWSDAAIYYYVDKESIQKEEQGELSLHIVLVDNETGIIAAKRTLNLKHKMRDSIYSLVRELPALSDIETLTRASQVTAMYTTEELVQQAIIIDTLN